MLRSTWGGGGGGAGRGGSAGAREAGAGVEVEGLGRGGRDAAGHAPACGEGAGAVSSSAMNRQEKVTRALLDYVASTAQDSRWQQVILPLRDGISVARRVA